MSYQSKYTGPEIDSLLDSIGQIGGNNLEVTTLLEGKFGSNAGFLDLADNPANYDIIIVEGWFGNSETDSQTATVTLFKETLDFTAKSQYGFLLAGQREDNLWYSLLCTLSETQLWVGSYMHSTTGYASGYLTKVYGIKLPSATSGASSSNPIGAIIPIMGTTAPKDYLICDGSELNINEYKELADYFEAQFGTKNHFGGDGVNTFAIPDLRNEFLRGYGELSGEIGIHQNATEIPNIWYSVNGDLAFHTGPLQQNGVGIRKYADTTTKDTNSSGGKYTANMGTWSGGDKTATYTARPTNVAVLFCIKYTESASSSNASRNFVRTSLLSEPVQYTMSINSANILNTELTLNEDISNYDAIVFDYSVVRSSDGAYMQRSQLQKSVDDIMYNTTNNYATIDDGSSFFINTIWNGGTSSTQCASILAYFKNGTTLGIGFATCNNSAYNKIRIWDIKGIKY